MTPPKRPPPPSPVRKAAGSKPAAPSAAREGGGALQPLFLWGGIGLGLAATLGIAVVLMLVMRGPPPDVLNTTIASAAPAVPPAVATAPQPADVVAPEPIAPSPASAPMIPVPAVAATNSIPVPASGVNPTVVVPAPQPPSSTPPPPVPNPTSTGNALADVRQRSRRLPLPETKDATRQNLTTIQVDSPQRCDLTLLGGDEVCPPGSVLKLVRQDPAPDERVWNVMLKSTGALSKEKAIADFRLKGDQLSFQWQKLSGGSLLPAIMFCLLRIDAAGEQELCQLCKPLTSTPLPLKLADRWTIEAQIPGNALGTLPVRAEPLAIDFPNVNIPGASTLAAGETTTFKISGQASGSLAVDLELELKLEQKDGKLQLIIVPYSEPPNVARADRPPMRAVISPTQIKRRKAELTKASAVAESQAKTLKTQFERSERDEQTLSATIPMNINQRTLLSQQLLQVRQQIAIIEPKLDEAETTHKTLHAAAAWYTDMVTLLEQLQNQSKLGLRLFRTVGTERIVIAEPVANP